MLASDKDGEAFAAVLAIRRVLRANKRDLHDLAALIERAPPLAPPLDDLPPWRAMVQICSARADRLNTKERAFVRSLVRWRGEPTEKQLNWLADLFERVAA